MAEGGEKKRRVFVNGYGSIGRRITAFVRDDPQIDLVGIGKHTLDAGAIQRAAGDGLAVYVPRKKIGGFQGTGVAGTIEDALDASDLVIDASPGGRGYSNKVDLYKPRGIKAIYQGGESVTGDAAVSDMLFNSRANYDDVKNRMHVMQGSCNVTGMGRILGPLRDRFGGRLARLDVTLIRRWADIDQTDKKVEDTIEMTQNPHHGDDVKTYLGADAPLFVRAVKVPTRQMHLHVMDVRFGDGPTPKPSEIHDVFRDEFGVAVLWTARGTKEVRDFAGTMGFYFTDTNMIHIHANMTASIGDTVQMMYSDDQTGIVIPENHMLMQAMLFDRPRAEALTHTESVFHMAEKKRRLEEHFAVQKN